MKKALVLTYYWPPSGGSGVQRWMYFCKYLPLSGIEPVVVTVEPTQASYKFTDASFLEKVKDVTTFRTSTLEPLKWYSRILSGNSKEGIPGGFAGENKPGLFQKLSRYIRGNFFLPDARRGWIPYAFEEARRIIKKENIDLIITTGPPHSTHLAGLRLKRELNIRWIADFRDPWTELYYNRFLYRTEHSKRKDSAMELDVLKEADMILTVGPGLQKLLAEKIPSQMEKVHVIFNGYDEDLFHSLSRTKNKENFTICHIGILGESQPLSGFLDALMEIKKSHPDTFSSLLLQVTGKVSPAILNEIKRMLPDLKLDIREYVPHKEAIQMMLNADMLLSSLAVTEFSHILISGKLMEYLASGNPVLCLGDTSGDAASLLAANDHAMVFDRKNVQGIKDFMLRYIQESDKDQERIFPDPKSQPYARKATTALLGEKIKKLFF